MKKRLILDFKSMSISEVSSIKSGLLIGGCYEGKDPGRLINVINKASIFSKPNFLKKLKNI